MDQDLSPGYGGVWGVCGGECRLRTVGAIFVILGVGTRCLRCRDSRGWLGGARWEVGGGCIGLGCGAWLRREGLARSPARCLA